MTTREKLETMLLNRGMFPDQIKQVLDEAIPEIEKISGKITWDRSANEYPDIIYMSMFIHIKPIALK